MFEELKDSIIAGDKKMTIDLTQKYLDEGIEPNDILDKGLIAGMDVVGRRFKAYDIYLPEVIMSATAMKNGMGLIKSFLNKSVDTSMGKIVMATIEGDVHDIGKNLVSMMLEVAGFEIVDLGVDISPDKIINTAEKENVDLIGMSTLLTTTMIALEPTIRMIRERNSKVKIMVGGAPITKEFADKIGADGFAPDALRAVDLAKMLV